MKTLVLLKQFHNSANKDGFLGSDTVAFEKVLFCSWETGEVISKDVFLKVLKSNTFDGKAGFTQEMAEELFHWYRSALKLLSADSGTIQ